MKLIARSLLAAVLAGVVMLTACGGGPKGGSSQTVDPTAVKGTVKVAIGNGSLDDEKQVVASFNKLYPNVTVNIVGYDGGLTDYLTAQAAASTMPDVVVGWDNLSYFASQGWLYPLDSLLAKDPEKQYIFKPGLDGFTYNGKTYAVPAYLQFSCIVVNLDLLDELNLDAPSYDWTIDDFMTLAKKATTDRTSGINYVDGLDSAFTNVMLKAPYQQYGYDPSMHTFNFTSGAWAKGLELQKELKEYPGLVSDLLKNSSLTSAGKMDDYQKKFGKDADAFRESKVLFGNHSTWDYSWLKTLSYKWDYYPIPQDSSVGFREPTHEDYGVMFSTVKDENADAAYALLKYLTFGKDGTIARMDYFANKKVGSDGKQDQYFVIPATSQPDVVKYFEGLDFVPGGLKDMFKRVINDPSKSVKADYDKVLPDFWANITQYTDPAKDAVNKGQAAASLAQQTQDQVNALYKTTWSTFSDKITKVQKEFDTKHSASSQKK